MLLSDHHETGEHFDLLKRNRHAYRAATTTCESVGQISPAREWRVTVQTRQIRAVGPFIGALVLFIAVTGATVQNAIAAVRWVDPAWIDDGALPEGLALGVTAFGSISEAVRASEPGDTIVLRSGRYETQREELPIVVDRTVQIRSASGPEETTVVGSPATTVFEVTAPGVQINGLTIEVGFSGLVILADDVVVADNRFVLSPSYSQSSSCGIWLAGSRRARICSNEFSRCGLSIVGPPVGAESQSRLALTGLFEVGEDREFFTTHVIQHNTVNGRPLFYCSNASDAVVPSEVGQVLLVGCNDVVVNGVEISHTSVGIQISHCQGVRVTNAAVSECRLFGIYAAYSTGVLISGTCCSSSTHGLDLRGVGRSLIEASNFSGCDQGVFLAASHDSIVSECTIDRNGIGVYLDGGERNRVCGSRIADNGLGIYARGETSLAIVDSRVTGNSVVGLRVSRESQGGLVHNNRFLENATALVVNDSSEISVSSNSFARNAQSGVFVTNSRAINLVQNEFAANTTGVSLTGSASDVTVLYNSFDGSGIAVRNSTGSILNLSLNRWGVEDESDIPGRIAGLAEYRPFL